MQYASFVLFPAALGEIVNFITRFRGWIFLQSEFIFLIMAQEQKPIVEKPSKYVSTCAYPWDPVSRITKVSVQYHVRLYFNLKELHDIYNDKLEFCEVHQPNDNNRKFFQLLFTFKMFSLFLESHNDWSGK